MRSSKRASVGPTATGRSGRGSTSCSPRPVVGCAGAASFQPLRGGRAPKVGQAARLRQRRGRPGCPATALVGRTRPLSRLGAAPLLGKGVACRACGAECIVAGGPDAVSDGTARRSAPHDASPRRGTPRRPRQGRCLPRPGVNRRSRLVHRVITLGMPGGVVVVGWHWPAAGSLVYPNVAVGTRMGSTWRRSARSYHVEAAACTPRLVSPARWTPTTAPPIWPTVQRSS